MPTEMKKCWKYKIIIQKRADEKNSPVSFDSIRNRRNRMQFFLIKFSARENIFL